MSLCAGFCPPTRPAFLLLLLVAGVGVSHWRRFARHPRQQRRDFRPGRPCRPDRDGDAELAVHGARALEDTARRRHVGVIAADRHANVLASA